MQCTRCQQDNPPQARFRTKGGASVTLTPGHAAPSFPSRRVLLLVRSTSRDSAAREPRFTDPGPYTPKHLAAEILTSRSARESERRTGDRVLRRSRE
jgi:hypothetical protein